MYARQKGLTLVELMVVVAVMAIIAAIAYPLYTTQTQKARRADAKIALEAIAMAQERFYTANGSYTTSLSSLQVSTAIQGGNSDEGFYTIAAPTLTGGGQGYWVRATADSSGAQASDAANCATFTVDHTGRKTATGGSASTCW
ncbi:MAG: prepilin-type N-terminal cleavage/methylation domain-containing protein [Gammaproteobacteria bacterium]|nr:prepilin-type N-terminal cleavage/methylation domain-containing protein [Gammaproteobacteria bacterium]